MYSYVWKNNKHLEYFWLSICLKVWRQQSLHTLLWLHIDKRADTMHSIIYKHPKDKRMLAFVVVLIADDDNNSNSIPVIIYSNHQINTQINWCSQIFYGCHYSVYTGIYIPVLTVVSLSLIFFLHWILLFLVYYTKLLAYILVCEMKTNTKTTTTTTKIR